MAAHRYWRLWCTGSPSSWVAASEIEFRGAAGGADLCVGGTPFSSGSYQNRADRAADKAFDDSTSTYYESEAAAGSNRAWWIGYDFGAGNDKSIAEVAWRATSSANEVPTAFVVQSSDDGERWLDEWSEAGITGWASNATKVFTRDAAKEPPAPTAHRRWRLAIFRGAASVWTSFAEIELRGVVGGADLTAAGTASASSWASATFDATKATDNAAATYWAPSASGFQWWAFDFGAGVQHSVAQFALTARNDASYVEAPGVFQLQSSDDGATWTTAATYSTTTGALAWTQGQTRTFLGVAPATTIGGVAPQGGATAGGTAVTIAGSGFVAGATVTFGGVAATSVVVVNDATIACVAPAHASGLVDVVVTTGAGTATLAGGFRYYAVTSVAPGTVSAGDTITIDGSGFTGTTPTVTVGGVPATDVAVVDDTTITATVPPGVTPGSADVVVTIGGGSTTLPGAVVASLDYSTTELLAFKTATLHADNTYQWDLTSLRRGAWGTPNGTHPAGSKFLAIDSRVLRVALPQSRFGVPLYVKIVPFNIYGGGRPKLEDVPAHTFNLPLQGSIAPDSATVSVLTTAPAPSSDQWRAAAVELLHGRIVRVQWTFTPPYEGGARGGSELPAELPAMLGSDGQKVKFLGFDVAVHTGTNADDASSYVLPVQEVGPDIRDAILAASAKDAPVTIRASVRARYEKDVRSPWRLTGNSDVIPANTIAFPTKPELLAALDLNGHQVFFQTSAPTSGMAAGDYWFDTTPVGDGTLRYTPYKYDGALWVPEAKAILVASALAAGAVTAREIRALSITVDKLSVGLISDNLWPNATSENAPPSGADTTGPEFAWRSNAGGSAYSGNWYRLRSNTSGAQERLTVTVPCGPGQSFHIEAMCGSTAAGGAGVFVAFLDAAGAVVGLGSTAGSEAAGGGWGRVYSSGTAPAGTVAALLYLWVNNGQSGWWDSIYARRMVDGSILTVDALRTSNYAESGGYATAGAKLDHAGVALKVAPGGLMVGATSFADIFQNAKFVKYGAFGRSPAGALWGKLCTVATLSAFQWRPGATVTALKVTLPAWFNGIPHVVLTPKSNQNLTTMGWDGVVFPYADIMTVDSNGNIVDTQTNSFVVGILDGNRNLVNADAQQYAFDFIAIDD